VENTPFIDPFLHEPWVFHICVNVYPRSFRTIIVPFPHRQPDLAVLLCRCSWNVDSSTVPKMESGNITGEGMELNTSWNIPWKIAQTTDKSGTIYIPGYVMGLKTCWKIGCYTG
jgi:hypothetical protein